jgi:hypothetical protein
MHGFNAYHPANSTPFTDVFVGIRLTLRIFTYVAYTSACGPCVAIPLIGRVAPVSVEDACTCPIGDGELTYTASIFSQGKEFRVFVLF